MKIHDRRSRPTVLYGALLLALLAGNAQAARLNYRFDVTALHSDNIDLSENDEISETAIIPGVTFDVEGEGAAVEFQARGHIERRHYLDNQFPDETRSDFAGQLNWTVIPQRMSFVLEDYLSQEPINFRDGRYPGNVQQVNVFLAGPSFFARMGPATRLQLDLRGVDSHAEESPDFDGRRYSAAASLQRELSPTTKASLNLATTKADFEDEATTIDYKRHDGFVRFERNMRRMEYLLDLGYTRLDRELASDESTALVRASVQAQLTGRSRLRFRARHQFADEVQDLIVRLSDPDEELIPDLADVSSSSLATAGVYRQHMMDLDYRYTGERLSLRVRPQYRRLTYLDREDADRRERAGLVRVDYRLRPLVTVFASVSARKRTFLTGNQEDEDLVCRVGFDHQLSRHWGWRAEAIRNERDSNVVDARYTENAVLVSVWWKR
jgi:hypothetical protein